MKTLGIETSALKSIYKLFEIIKLHYQHQMNHNMVRTALSFYGKICTFRYIKTFFPTEENNISYLRKDMVLSW